MHGRRQEADLLRELAAHALDAGEQVALAVLVHQRDQAVAEFQAELVHRLQVVPAGFAVALRRGRGGALLGWWRLVREHPGGVAQQAGHGEEHQVGHAGNQAQQAQHAGGDAHGARRDEHLAGDLLAQVLVLAHTRDHHGGRDRNEQAGNLRHQRVTDGQQDVAVGRLAGRQAVLRHADGKAADDVDEEDKDAGDGVTTHELGGTVHGAEEVRFLAHFGAAALGFLLVDDAGLQIGVHCHLLAGHGVQREARGDFRNTLRALGHHHEVDDHQDGKHDQADGEVAADQEVAEGLDHRAGGPRTGMAFEQHDARGGHVERQAHQRGQQQHGRKSREVQRPEHVGRDHHHHQRHGDVDGEQDVEQPGRQRQHHHGKDGDHQQRRARPGEQGGVAAVAVLQVLEQRVHAALGVGWAWRSCGSRPGGTGGCGGSPGIGPSPRRAARRR